VNIFHSLQEATHVSWVVWSSLFAAAVLLVSGVLVRGRLVAAQGGLVPDEGFSLRNVLELLVEMLKGLAEQNMGPHWRRYFPIIGTIFFFILISNLMGLVPGLAGSTSDASTTWAWAIIAWIFYTVIGVMEHKAHYLLKFLGPSFGEMEIAGRHIHIRALAPVFFVLEVPLDLARILTLAVRLLANMFADHTVVAVWLTLVPIVVPAVFMGLGLIVAFLQAFVFALLTMIYIGLALEEPH
jgi:F-type H+-transporting ATPase subunit a